MEKYNESKFTKTEIEREARRFCRPLTQHCLDPYQTGAGGKILTFLISVTRHRLFCWAYFTKNSSHWDRTRDQCFLSPPKGPKKIRKKTQLFKVFVRCLKKIPKIRKPSVFLGKDAKKSKCIIFSDFGFPYNWTPLKTPPARTVISSVWRPTQLERYVSYANYV